MLRTLNSFWKTVAFIFSAIMIIYQILVLGFIPIDSWINRATYFLIILTIGFLLFKRSESAPDDRPELLDGIMIALSVAVWLYILINYNELIWRIPIAATTLDGIVGFILVLCVLELVRRTQGRGIFFLGIFFILYAAIGHWIPGNMIGHSYYPFNRIFATYFSSYGMYGTIMGITASYIFIFVFFGAMLKATGLGNYFLTLSNYLAGWTRGGPAKVAVVASSLFGSVSGSAAANAVATGSITIPMMKSNGYDKSFAASVESLASTGGQIAPPIMGAGAFLMAQMVGVSYLEVILTAAIPAIIFYFNAFMCVDFSAAKLGYRGLRRDEIPSSSEVIKQIYLLLPLVVLVYTLLGPKLSIVRVGFAACLSCVAVSFVQKKNWLNLEKVKRLTYETAKNMVGITAITGVAGLVISTLTLTGLAMNVSRVLIAITGGNLLLALILTMLVTLILGMGMPTTAAYIIAASVLAPALNRLGLPPLNAHLFIFYFATLSGITPPICVVSFAAATIAEAEPMKVGLRTCLMGLAAFIVPYLFTYDNSLLFMGDLSTIIYNVFRVLLGVAAMSGSIIGWWIRGEAVKITRVLLGVAAALLLLKTGLLIDILGYLALILTLFTGVIHEKVTQTA